MTPSPAGYLSELLAGMKRHWPENRSCRIVCHGHSVPAGYFRTPVVDTFNSYPHLLHRGLCERFPFAVINVLVTAIGGEQAESGAKRFAVDCLGANPDVVLIDYALNDRGLGLERAKAAWESMLGSCRERRIPVLLLTPSLAVMPSDREREGRMELERHAEQIRALARDWSVGLADTSRAWDQYLSGPGQLSDLLSQVNHPNRAGHELIARELLRWFPADA